MNRGVFGAPHVQAALLLLALVSFGSFGCRSEDPKRPPNLVLISLVFGDLASRSE